MFLAIFKVIGFATGELLLWLITLGRRKPRLYASKSIAEDELLITGSTVLGFIFWGAVSLVVTRWLVR